MEAAASAWSHTPVLLKEAVDAVLHTPDGIYVDGTFGRGGHSRAILARLSTQGRLIAIDRDPQAVLAAKQGPQAIHDARFSIHHAAFAEAPVLLARLGITRLAGLLLDLGVSSPQIDDPERGFSFRFDAPLDMRMDTSKGETVADFLARAQVPELAEVIREYGEERFAGPIARAIVARREAGRALLRTAELAELVAVAVKTREGGQHPATRTFQALRIYINGELDQLGQALDASIELLQPLGRLAVISFHSLEDRMVKQFIARNSQAVFDRRAPFAAPTATRLRALGRIRAGQAEIAANPRARSAVLRVAERAGAGASA